ncbi:MAG TPA: hypothetical protein VNH44_06385 [Micropepsaceae bacterium]|nr:hypothetical protein [Micropepsaceae bacterium]
MAKLLRGALSVVAFVAVFASPPLCTYAHQGWRSLAPHHATMKINIGDGHVG